MNLKDLAMDGKLCLNKTTRKHPVKIYTTGMPSDSTNYHVPASSGLHILHIFGLYK